MIHRDIKPEFNFFSFFIIKYDINNKLKFLSNILLKNGKIKIGDLGLADTMSVARIGQGTIAYMAPEMINLLPNITKKTDIW